MVEALIAADPAPGLVDLLAGDVYAPHLLDVEVASVLRGLNIAGKLSDTAAGTAHTDFAALTINRYAFAPLAARAWQLRHRFTTYDASYLALAEALRAPLVTCDRTLAAPGHQANVVLIAP